MIKQTTYYLMLSMLVLNTTWAATAKKTTVINLVIETPKVNAPITKVNQEAVIVNGVCSQGAPVRIIATDSANKSTEIQWTGCNSYSDFHGQLNLGALKDGSITIKTMQDLNGASKAVTVNVVKTTAVVTPPTTLNILSPVKDFAVTTANQASVEISGKCADKLVMKLQATDSVNKLSEITWIMCENSNFWGPINMTSLKDGNINVRAFQEVNGVMVNKYVNVIKKTAVVTPPAPALAVTLGVLASVKEGVASLLTVNKVAGTAAGTMAYQVFNNASKAVISSGSLVFAANDTSKTISILAPEDSVYNADMKLEIKVGAFASLIVPVVDNDPIPPVSSKIMMGINGHDNFDAYPASEIEARVKVLADRNIRSFRNGGDSSSQEPLWDSMDALIAAGKKHNVIIRPALYHWLGEAQAYKIAKRFPDIRVWEIGNEVDGDVGNEAKNIAQMVQVYKGIKRAAAEMGIEIKTTINIMACNSDATTAQGGRCYKKADGSGYFVDAAYAAGFKFDYISFHYYPYYTDKADNNGYYYKMYLGQMRTLAERYNVKILFNETNCAEIYPWSVTTGNVTDGGYAGDKRCYDSLKQLLTELNTNYKDIVQEINLYEMLDEPSHPVTHEKHFGMMYDLNNPKPVFEMITKEFAK
ncbi:hypothetical protein SHI21_07500 [Bacteriovorax sp. PP10]|uniref:Arabinogalactan endo-beta-1,4-galactanase n=1 Tax=Bacteriovorax antarcticus TaxID=3088717 RepID=A0ABU5VUK3_9BACT|nr:hypothetical protein [Bacteriovorax sp. PP10]MEA9356039.1 hypothetical protein [Bacteriovorax sp. PP10]